jgi:hypothetical protein
VVEVVVEVDDVVDVVVEVDVEVVTGTVVVVADSSEVDVPASTDDEVDPGLVELVASLLHEAMAKASTTTKSGASRFGFTVGSLARVVVIT